MKKLHALISPKAGNKTKPAAKSNQVTLSYLKFLLGDTYVLEERGFQYAVHKNPNSNNTDLDLNSGKSFISH